MAPEKVKLAFVGLGNWGSRLAAAAERSGAAEPVRCFARTEETRNTFAEKFGGAPASSLDEILKDDSVEGLVISTPHSTHLEIIREAASAGKHIFVEKPLTLTVQEGRQAITAAEAAGVTLQVGHHRRRLGATRKVRSMIEAGELGMLHQLEAHVFNANRQSPAQGWHNDPAEWPLGGMTGRGVHMIDNFHYLAGPIKRVSTFSKKILGATQLDDATVISLEFESGPLGYIAVSQVVPFSILTSALGTEAAAWSDEDGAKLYVQKKNETSRTEIPVEAGDALADQMTEFARCIRTGEKPEIGGAEALEVVAAFEAIVESAASGQVVEVSKYRN
ncbi:MAG: Gfo/Idh/MocA family oxidoreductase [Nitrospinaceae bacterium]|nr:Gfo/Idh/MocA family oxidoreductase [Nitrospinaceae bacterium]